MSDKFLIFALPFRLVGFLLFQLLISVFVGWDASSGWWPIAALATNLATIALLLVLTKRGTVGFWSVLQIRRESIKQDLLWLVPVIILAMPLAYIPNIGVASLLFGDPELALSALVQPLPLWAVILAIGFPLTIMFAELPLYFGYIMPRLKQRAGSALNAIAIPALFLSLQHVTLPLIFDWRFALWRAVMFLPFALLVGFAIHRRPSLLPYLVVIHGLIDLGMVTMLFPLAY